MNVSDLEIIRIPLNAPKHEISSFKLGVCLICSIFAIISTMTLGATLITGHHFATIPSLIALGISAIILLVIATKESLMHTENYAQQEKANINIYYNIRDLYNDILRHTSVNNELRVADLIDRIKAGLNLQHQKISNCRIQQTITELLIGQYIGEFTQRLIKLDMIEPNKLIIIVPRNQMYYDTIQKLLNIGITPQKILDIGLSEVAVLIKEEDVNLFKLSIPYDDCLNYSKSQGSPLVTTNNELNVLTIDNNQLLNLLENLNDLEFDILKVTNYSNLNAKVVHGVLSQQVTINSGSLNGSCITNHINFDRPKDRSKDRSKSIISRFVKKYKKIFGLTKLDNCVDMPQKSCYRIN